MPSFSTTTTMLMLAMGMAAGSAQSASAQPMQDAPGTVVRAGDADMTCHQMADEGAALSADMGEAGPGLLGRVGGIARAGATMLIPAAGLAVAGAEALTSPGKSRREAEADTRRDRWNYLNGLYAGRGCDGNAAQPGPTPAQATAPAASTTVPSPPAPDIRPAVFPH